MRVFKNNLFSNSFYLTLVVIKFCLFLILSFLLTCVSWQRAGKEPSPCSPNLPPFFKSLFIHLRDRVHTNRGRGRRRGTSSSLLSQLEPCCGAGSQELEIRTRANGRHLTIWASPTPLFKKIIHEVFIQCIIVCCLYFLWESNYPKMSMLALVYFETSSGFSTCLWVWAFLCFLAQPVHLVLSFLLQI